MSLNQESTPTSAPSPDFVVRPVDPMMGAEILGADLAQPLSEATIDRFRTALNRYKVLVFRDQHLSKEDLVTLSQRWGTLGTHIMQGTADETVRQVNVMSNVGPDGRPNGKHTDETAKRWHTDRSWGPNPVMATVLYGIEVPETGGDTAFANMTLAYEELPETTRRRVAALQAIHSIEYSRRAGGGRPATPEEIRFAPPVKHPLVRTHPETNEKALYCGCHAWKIDGLPEEEGRALLDELAAFATQEPLRLPP